MRGFKGAGEITPSDNLAGRVNALCGAERTAEGTEVIGERIDGAVGGGSEGVDVADAD